MQLPAILPLAAFTLLISATALRAQDPALAPDNLKASRKAIEQQHLIADCTFRTAPNRIEKFRYDQFPDIEKITLTSAIFARPKGQPWLKSDDWGGAGEPVDKAKAADLDRMAAIVHASFLPPPLQDPSQGGFVWRFVRRTSGKNYETFTYVRSREKPRPGGAYPAYTFTKHKGDKDGSLLLTGFRADILSGNRAIPASIQYSYLPLQTPAAAATDSATPSPTPNSKTKKKKH